MNRGSSNIWVSEDAGLSVHRFGYSAGELNLPDHTHPDFNITVCEGPSIEYSVRGGLVTLKPGDIIVINPGEPHHGVYGDAVHKSRGLTFHVSSRTLAELMHRMHLPWAARVDTVQFMKHAHDPKALQLVQELATEMEQRSRGFELVVSSLAIQFLVYLLRNALEPTATLKPRVVKPQLSSWKLVRALEIMNATPRNAFSISHLCSMIPVSSSQFAHLFANSMQGMTPGVCYTRLLMMRAKNMLLNDSASVKTVALDLGFNQSHFCSVFRQSFGVTPGSYCKANDEGDVT